MLFKITVEASFDAAHYLRGYKGACERLHGHTYRVRATASRGSLDELGMVLDFKEMRSVLNRAVADMDHALLNELEPFQRRNPSAENIADYIFTVMEPLLTELDARLDEVTVWETPGNSVTRCRDEEA